MRDDFLSRDWAEHHGSMSDGVGQLIDRFWAGLKRLHARQFDAPWKAARRERCS